jgi:uncharacterized membrane protein
MKYMAVFFITIPFTIFMGMFFFNDRQFFIISLLILLQTLIPFFFLFEKRKLQARELVIIAVLCAIGVAGRGAFFMLPQFKPVIAIVIIAGVALGWERGFLIGALTMFVSNMFFGQGPWTPWQMFAFGLIGFISGIVFKKGRLSRRPVVMAVFGGFAALVVYGGIMNPANVLMYQSHPAWGMFVAAYITGLPFDLVHAVATVVFLLLLSKVMLEKLDRVKTKYGVL